MERLGRSLALGALGLAFSLTPAVAVQVAPHAVFMDQDHRSGQLFLANRSTRPAEVTSDLKFGYLDADSTGNVYVHLIDSPDSTQPSAAGWINVFPRRMVLKAGGSQVVRLLATPPAGLPDGEYWTRLIVTSHERLLTASGSDQAVNVSIPVEARTIVSVLYRNGVVQTGLRVGLFRAAVQKDSLVARVGLSRQGNAAYLGTTVFRLLNVNGLEVRKWEMPVAVYYRLERRYTFPLDFVVPGRYSLHLDISTARSDVHQRNILPAPPIADSTSVEVP